VHKQLKYLNIAIASSFKEWTVMLVVLCVNLGPKLEQIASHTVMVEASGACQWRSVIPISSIKVGSCCMNKLHKSFVVICPSRDMYRCVPMDVWSMYVCHC